MPLKIDSVSIRILFIYSELIIVSNVCFLFSLKNTDFESVALKTVELFPTEDLVRTFITIAKISQNFLHL